MAIEGVRARARAAVRRELVTEARRQLAEVGPAALSLRAVARDAGMVSSGVYRYFGSRDELLTALIIDAYDDLGAYVERSVRRSASKPPLMRWLDACRAIRRWATEHPHDWALLYGTPVPGYEAPPDTIGPAQRVTAALAGIVADAQRSGRLATAGSASVLSNRLFGELQGIADDLDVPIPPGTVVLLIAAWSQVFGMVSLELFGQTAGAVTAHADLFTATASTSGQLVGLGLH